MRMGCKDARVNGRGMKNKYSIFFFLLLALAAISAAASEAQSRFVFPGGGSLLFSAPLGANDRANFGPGWKRAIYLSPTGRSINLLPMESFTSEEGIVYENDFSPQISPTGRYVALDVIRALMVSSRPGDKPTAQSRQYCPVLDTQTGCIVSMQTGELCGGEWNKGRDSWVVGGKDQDDVDGAMLNYDFDSANVLWQGYLAASMSSSQYSIKSALKDNLGAENMIACEPPSSVNRDAYAQIARQLRREGDQHDAEYMESNLALAAQDKTPVPTSKIVVDKAPLYDQPDETFKTRMYLVKGDEVMLLGTNKLNWILVKYVKKDGVSILKWMKANSVNLPESAS